MRPFRAMSSLAVTTLLLILVSSCTIRCINGQMLAMTPPQSGAPRMLRPQPLPLQQILNPMQLQRTSRQQQQQTSCQINVPNCGVRSSSAVSLEATPEPSLKYVSSSDIPWHVAVRIQPSSTSKPWFCSGAIINENWLLCPAYCLFLSKPGDLSTKSIKIAAGITNPFTNQTTFTGIISYSIHGSYTGSKSNGFDIALIKSAVEFPLSTNGPINAVCLPEGVSPPLSELEVGPVKCSGWPGMGINNLVMTSSFSDSIDRCVGVNTHDLPNELCSMSQSPPDCQLDGGSPCFRTIPVPLPVAGQSSPAILIGMLSKKVTCKKPNTSSFSTSRMTRISSFIGWISDTIGACSSQLSSSRGGSNQITNSGSLTVSRSDDKTKDVATNEGTGNENSE